MIRSVIHIILHFLVPAVVARFSFREQWWKAWLIMISAMVIDFDHLLADPIYDPNRCSIGFHPLHSYIAVCAYFVMMAAPKTRIIAIGLLIHIGVDLTDCIWMRWE